MANDPTFDNISNRLNKIRERMRRKRLELYDAFASQTTSQSNSAIAWSGDNRRLSHGLHMVIDGIVNIMLDSFASACICPLTMHSQVKDHMLAQGRNDTWSEQVTKDDLVSVIDRHYEAVVATYKGGAAQLIEDAFRVGISTSTPRTLMNIECELVGTQPCDVHGDDLH